MQNFLHEEEVNFFVYYITFPYGLRMMDRNTLSEPQPDSASWIKETSKYISIKMTAAHLYSRLCNVHFTI